MSRYPYFAEDDPTGASRQELKKRWKTFHRAVRTHSDRPLARVLGPLLGDDTRRRRWATALEQRLRPAPSVAEAPQEGARPLTGAATLRPQDQRELSPEMIASVAVVPVSDATTDLYERIDRALESGREWLLIAHEDDPTPLACVAWLWPYRMDADVIFADEERGGRFVLKSAIVGPHTMLSENAVGRPALLRRSTVAAIERGSEPAASAEEWDLMLRLVESGARFHHVPLVLPGGRRPSDDPTFDDASAMIARAFERRGHQVSLTPGRHEGHVQWHVTTQEWPRVEILIPTRDRLDLLARSISSVVETSTYPNFSITVLDNDSVEPETLDYFEASPHRVVPCPGPFNYAAIMNRGVAHSEVGFIVTLNNDTIISTPDWLERMVGAAMLDDVALVGCRQVNQYGVHDHDGIIIAPYPQHLRFLHNWSADDIHVHARRDVAAVTGAVTLVRRDAWNRVGGMDESLAVVMNDVDLCLRLQQDGAYVLYLPDVEVVHYASSSRGRLDPIADRNRFVRRWDIFGSFVDPFFPERLRLFGNTMVVVPMAD